MKYLMYDISNHLYQAKYRIISILLNTIHIIETVYILWKTRRINNSNYISLLKTFLEKKKPKYCLVIAI